MISSRSGSDTIQGNWPSSIRDSAVYEIRSSPATGRIGDHFKPSPVLNQIKKYLSNLDADKARGDMVGAQDPIVKFDK